MLALPASTVPFVECIYSLCHQSAHGGSDLCWFGRTDQWTVIGLDSGRIHIYAPDVKLNIVSEFCNRVIAVYTLKLVDLRETHKR